MACWGWLRSLIACKAFSLPQLLSGIPSAHSFRIMLNLTFIRSKKCSGNNLPPIIACKLLGSAYSPSV